MTTNKQQTALVTGSAGFIGYHISKKLLDEGWRVIGLDCMSDYYDVSLKEQRELMLLQSASYRSVREKVEAPGVLIDLFKTERPNIVIHLAAQAGVRYSIENPRAYLESNINGTFELLEAARAYPPMHMLLASTSSAYGANEDMPYRETVKADNQVSFYAATKKSTENMAHSYAHLFNIPTTMLRFFTVYGPWGRPDMALYRFTKKILDNQPIQLYNKGRMQRDFTYIIDIVDSVMALVDCPPIFKVADIDSKSPVAPFRVVNIGSSRPQSLGEFVSAIENALGVSVEKQYLPIQAGDVSSTWADTTLLVKLTGYRPETRLSKGIPHFIKWYLKYHNL